ncbi:MAG: M23 family metallopeptidase [Spirochaetales bacterium]|nr:M23 family metallopeptidase [Spirochaetales bacterium]
MNLTDYPLKHSIILLFSLLILLLIEGNAFTDNLYPLIERMDQSDLLFKQISDDISSFYRNSEQNKDLRPLQIYRISLKKDSTIFEIAARFNLPYETITTLNHISKPVFLSSGTELLIPNTPGIFIPSIPVSDIEYMIKSWRNTTDSIELKINNGISSTFYFLAGEKFHKVERSFFLGLMFRFPLPAGIISSHFGERVNPITGSSHFHNGIDVAAPLGTEVMAARSGTVQFVGFNDICGNFISILHENSYETVYCHLKKVFVQLNQQVQSGMIIGTVGNTGMSTGPHLHFEIRSLGEPKDPSLMISGKIE